MGNLGLKLKYLSQKERILQLFFFLSVGSGQIELSFVWFYVFPHPPTPLKSSYCHSLNLYLCDFYDIQANAYCLAEC